MAQQQDDLASQRKRIAVACGRCRKRKIRCSGDPGNGQPCSNCKNAGVDQCQFLRVFSREAPIRHDASDFAYSVGDARVFASRTPVEDLPTLGPSDVLGSYRTGPSCSYTPVSKTYCPAMNAYANAYPPESFEFGIGVPPSSGVSLEPVSMLPSHWSSGARGQQPSFGGVYLDTDGAHSSLHQPSPSVNSDSPNFSFSGVAASLSLASTPGPDRLLPNPTGRSSTLPFPSALKPPAPPSGSSATTLADVASAATYASGFDAPGILYSSAARSSRSTPPSHQSWTSRSNSDTYSASEGIFPEQERGIQSQGPSFDMHSNYTASLRRGLAEGGSDGSHSGYVPGESTYMSDSPSSPIAHRHGQHTAAAENGSASHSTYGKGRQIAVTTRH